MVANAAKYSIRIQNISVIIQGGSVYKGKNDLAF